MVQSVECQTGSEHLIEWWSNIKYIIGERRREWKRERDTTEKEGFVVIRRKKETKREEQRQRERKKKGEKRKREKDK